jgi:hypothetical protein
MTFHEPPLLETDSISRLGVRDQKYELLVAQGIETIADVLRRTPNKVYVIRKLGRRTVLRLGEELQDAGYTWNGYEEWKRAQPSYLMRSPRESRKKALTERMLLIYIDGENRMIKEYPQLSSLHQRELLQLESEEDCPVRYGTYVITAVDTRHLLRKGRSDCIERTIIAHYQGQ